MYGRVVMRTDGTLIKSFNKHIHITRALSLVALNKYNYIICTFIYIYIRETRIIERKPEILMSPVFRMTGSRVSNKLMQLDNAVVQLEADLSRAAAAAAAVHRSRRAMLRWMHPGLRRANYTVRNKTCARVLQHREPETGSIAAGYISI